MLVEKIKPLKFHILAIFLMWLIISSGSFLLFREIRAEEADTDDGPDQAVITDLNRQIKEQQEKLDQLAKKIDTYNTNIKNARNESVSLNNQIYILDNQIAKAELDIEAKEEEIKTTELEIESVELEIKNSERKIETNKEQLSAFIRRLDQYDQKNYLMVLLSNNSFSEFFDQVKYLEGIEEEIQETLNRTQELVEKLSKQKEGLTAKKNQLSELLNKLEEEKLTLEKQKETKQYLINQTRSSEKKYQSLVTDLKAQQAAANSAVASLERTLRGELEKKSGGEKLKSFGEIAMIWPTASHRITAYFHDNDYPFRQLFEHSGLDLGVGLGTPVKAAESGYIAKVGINTQWYGNYIMIIHNNNLATLYAHLSSVSVKADDFVLKGQLIGSSGNTGFSTGPHLHFEVRSNGIPVNPLNYLP